MRHGIGHGIESGNYGYGWLPIAFIGLLLIIGITLLALWLFQRSKNGQHQENSKNAMEMLKRRYARGEIDKEEFEQMKKNLGSFNEFDKNENALEILERRYSLGEISNEEFQQKRKDIMF